MSDLPRERLLISLACTAHMEAGYEWAREYVKERHGEKLYCSRNLLPIMKPNSTQSPSLSHAHS